MTGGRAGPSTLVGTGFLAGDENRRGSRVEREGRAHGAERTSVATPSRFAATNKQSTQVNWKILDISNALIMADILFCENC